MRISDWSSDVCSSDLPPSHDTPTEAAIGSHRTISGVQRKLLSRKDGDRFRTATDDGPATHIAKYAPDSQPTLVRNEFISLSLARDALGDSEVTKCGLGEVEGVRSEEHTSELQSLM